MRDTSSYPYPTSEAARRVALGNRSRDTAPEVRLRAELHRRGLRFRKHRRPVATVRSTPDIVFGPARLAVFVDGCFWHCCPEHGRTPRGNAAYWVPKLARNVARDRRNEEALRAAGWQVIRVWEHEQIGAAADRVSAALRMQRRAGRN